MGSQNQKRWTPKEIEKLKAKYPTADLDALAKELNRSVRSLVCKAESVKVKRLRNNNVVEGQKFCSMCKQWHPVSEFYRNRAKLDGYEYYCKKYYKLKGKKKENTVVHEDKWKFSQASSRVYIGVNRVREKHNKREIITIDGVKGKECTECFTWKPLEDYSRQEKGTGGRTSKCKSCYKIYKYENKPSRAKASETKASKTKANVKPAEPKLKDTDIIKDGKAYRVCNMCKELKELNADNYYFAKQSGHWQIRCKECQKKEISKKNKNKNKVK